MQTPTPPAPLRAHPLALHGGTTRRAVEDSGRHRVTRPAPRNRRRRHVLGVPLDLLGAIGLTLALMVGCEQLLGWAFTVHAAQASTSRVPAGSTSQPWPTSAAAATGAQVRTDQGLAVYDGQRWVLCPNGWAETACHLPGQ